MRNKHLFALYLKYNIFYIHLFIQITLISSFITSFFTIFAAIISRFLSNQEKYSYSNFILHNDLSQRQCVSFETPPIIENSFIFLSFISSFLFFMQSAYSDIFCHTKYLHL